MNPNFDDLGEIKIQANHAKYSMRSLETLLTLILEAFHVQNWLGKALKLRGEKQFLRGEEENVIVFSFQEREMMNSTYIYISPRFFCNKILISLRTCVKYALISKLLET